MPKKKRTGSKAMLMKLHSHKVEEIEEGFDGIWIYLKPGYTLYGQNTVHEDNWRDILSKMSDVKIA